ncbi:MAG: hypothetical protein KDC44_05710 [Phaeodactylibacter sp.]|nr:hypothetical protein [Phaeodactylibacter sp.]
MKYVKIFCLSLAFTVSGLALSSCGSSTGESTGTEAAAEQGPEYTSAYVCPMHCEGSGSAEPGKCPVCGMDYVMNDAQGAQEGHEDHEGHDHEGHDH